MHYGEFKDTKDKIIHLLYAADFEGLYEKAKKECVNRWGREAIAAISTYEEDYRRTNKQLTSPGGRLKKTQLTSVINS